MKSEVLPARVLLADEHEHVLRDLEGRLNDRQTRRRAVGLARTVTETVFQMRACRPDVLVVADRLAGECALAGLARFLGSWPAAIIVRLVSGDERRRDLAFRRGADCVIAADHRAFERLLASIEELRRPGSRRLQ